MAHNYIVIFAHSLKNVTRRILQQFDVLGMLRSRPSALLALGEAQPDVNGEPVNILGFVYTYVQFQRSLV